ncbi:MAG: hypothetical protein D3906_08150, partial [Candidatus Electrothrix sp. AUS1_2]|nr:hypothetical protein [Candidatus Electrothrix sp. AUS1_2]
MKKEVSLQNRTSFGTTGTGEEQTSRLCSIYYRVVLVALSTLAALALFFAAHTQARNSPDQQNGLFTEVDPPDSSYRDDSDAVIRSRTVQIHSTQLGEPQQIALQSSQVQLEAVKPSPSLQLNLFDDLILQATQKKTYTNDSGSRTWIGTIPDQPMSQVIFVVRNSTVYGLVEAPGVGTFSIRPNAEGTHTIEEIRDDTILSGEDDSVLPDITSSDPLMQDMEAVETETAADAAQDDGSIIDVYVAYDQDASGGSVAAADAQSYAELFIAYTNQAYENSNIKQRVWLVGNVDGYDYTDPDPSSLNADLTAARNGSIDGLHDKRDKYHADLIMFILPYNGFNCGGLSYIQTTNDAVSWNTSAFSSMTGCLSGATFAHELGHLMGSRHDWYMDSETTPASIAHGYVDINNHFRTIMSYNNRCDILGFSCARIPYFSNPAITYNGGATGVASGTSSSCRLGDPSPTPECDADNTTNFNTKALITSRFRDSRVTWTGAVDTNWATAGNWSFNQGAPGATTVVNRVPRSYDNVSIPAGLVNYPT